MVRKTFSSSSEIKLSPKFQAKLKKFQEYQPMFLFLLSRLHSEKKGNDF